MTQSSDFANVNASNPEQDSNPQKRPALNVEPAEPMILMSGSLYGAVDDPSALVDAGEEPGNDSGCQHDSASNNETEPDSSNDSQNDPSSIDSDSGDSGSGDVPANADGGMPDPLEEPQQPSDDVGDGPLEDSNPSSGDPAPSQPTNSGDVLLLGGDGDDQIHGGTGDDLLKGEQGDDILFGGAGDDLIKGGEGRDTLFGGAGNDILRGESGNDVLVGGAGYDMIDGGEGHDTAVFDLGRNDYQIKNMGNGWFAISGEEGTDLVSNVETFQFADTQVLAADIPVSEGEVQVDGPESDFEMPAGDTGLDSTDTSVGDTDSDQVPVAPAPVDDLTADSDSELGDEPVADELSGDGESNEPKSVAEETGGDDSIADNSGEVTEEPAAPVESEPVSEPAADDAATGWAANNPHMGSTIDGAILDGGNGGDVLWGANGDDTLNGHDGNDTLRGGAGNDHIDGGAGFDTAVFTGDFNEFQVSAMDGGGFRIQGPDGDDTVINVERFQFKDRVVEANDLLAQAAAAMPVSNPLQPDASVAGWQANEIEVKNQEPNVEPENVSSQSGVSESMPSGVAANPWASALSNSEPTGNASSSAIKDVDTEGFDVVDLDGDGTPMDMGDKPIGVDGLGADGLGEDVQPTSELDEQHAVDEEPQDESNSPSIEPASEATDLSGDGESLAESTPASELAPTLEFAEVDSLPLAADPVAIEEVDSSDHDFALPINSPEPASELTQIADEASEQPTIPTLPPVPPLAEPLVTEVGAIEESASEEELTADENFAADGELVADDELVANDELVGDDELVADEENSATDEKPATDGNETEIVATDSPSYSATTDPEVTDPEVTDPASEEAPVTSGSSIVDEDNAMPPADELTPDPLPLPENATPEDTATESETANSETTDDAPPATRDDPSETSPETLDLSDCDSDGQGGRIDVTGGHAVIGSERFSFRDIGRFVGSQGNDVFLLNGVGSGEHYEIDGGQGDNVIELPNIRACDAEVSSDKIDVDGDIRVRRGHRTVTTAVKFDIEFRNICKVKFAGHEIVDVPQY